jgi:cation diffusion facilitator family transporter
MFAQGLQGFADLVTTLFLLLGVKRSKRKASATHPFGYGRELFFWVLISSLFAFLVSGGLASYRAIQEIVGGGELESIWFAIGVLSFGLITNGYSLSNSVRRLAQGVTGKSYWQYIRHSSLVETKMTLLVDFMGTLSAMFGLVALGLYQVTGNTLFDGIGALSIGLLTAAGALIVIIDLHDLIVGRSPHPQVIETIRKTTLRVKGVQDVLDLRAMSIGSEKILVILEVHFIDGLTTDEIEKVTDSIKEAVMAKETQVSRVQVEAETP